MSKTFRHALRNLRRDWRSGQLNLLGLSIIVAVASVSSISFFADRLKQVFESQATELLAADLVVISPEPIQNKLLKLAQQAKLNTSLQATFPSVVVANNNTQLVNIKSVSANYPLRGNLKISDKAYGLGKKTRALPKPGEAWVESRLMFSLKLKLGDSIQVGNTNLKISKILVYEPDRGSEFFNIAPRLLMRYQDLEKTKLIRIGSRVKYRLLVAGSVDQIKQYRNWAQSKLSKLESLQSLRDARPEIRVAIERGERYLSLASLVSILLAGVAIAISSQQFVKSHYDHCAIFKCLGAQQKTINQIYFWQFTLFGIAASSIGLLFGWLCQEGLAWIVADFITFSLPAPSLSPIIYGFVLGLGSLYLFSFSQIIKLKNTPPLRVIRRDLAPTTSGFRSIYFSLVVLLMLFLFYQLGDWAMAIRVLIASIITVAALALVSVILLKIIVFLNKKSKLSWRYGITNIIRRSQASNIQIIGFGIGLMALLLLSIVRTDLLTQWQTSLPKDAPNQFVINIQDNQLKNIKQFFSQHGYRNLNFYPMVRGRLIEINNKAVSPKDYDNARAKRFVSREFNLSWADELQEKNKVVEGQWWHKSNSKNKSLAQMSMEINNARLLGIKLGDTLTYVISGQTLSAKITSLRKINWDTMRPNFFLVAKPGLLEPYPRSWISSFHLETKNKDFLTKLINKFPNVTVIDVAIIIGQIRNIMDKAVLGIEFMFIFTLIAGFVVLLAAIEASQDERLKEGALIRALGGQRSLLLKSYFIEFAVIGLIAGLLAAIGASIAAYFISHTIMNIEFNLQFSWWAYGMLIGSIGIGLLGLFGSYKLIKKPPIESLRKL